VNRVEEDGS